MGKKFDNFIKKTICDKKTHLVDYKYIPYGDDVIVRVSFCKNCNLTTSIDMYKKAEKTDKDYQILIREIYELKLKEDIEKKEK